MIGSVVGSYKITDKIGEGGMGAVFKGVDVMLEREVAIKMLRPELARNPQIVERFRTEAVTLAKLNHPYIATLYSFIRQGDDFFMVMEYVNGDTLDDIVRKSGAMPLNRAVALACQALEGIQHAHNLDIIHRDIKPANMMVNREGTVKVMDFGIARVLGTDRLTKAGHLIGTVEYMSPEQVRGEETDRRSDVYSMGILLYEILTGRVPFTATSEYELMRRQIEDAPTPPRAFAAEIPLELEQVIMRSLAKRPEARHQTAGEFRELLLQQVQSSTSPLESPAAHYTAPATRFGNPMATAPNLPSRPSRPHTPTDPSLKETRLGTDSNIPATFASAPTVPVGPEAYVASQPQTRSEKSLLNLLTWKHYAGAGAVGLLLIAVPIALIGGKDKDPVVTQPQPKTSVQPSANPTPAQPSQPAAQEVPQQPGPALDNPATRDTQPATGAKPARKRGAQAQTPQPKPEEKKGGILDRLKGLKGIVTGKKPRN